MPEMRARRKDYLHWSLTETFNHHLDRHVIRLVVNDYHCAGGAANMMRLKHVTPPPR